MPQAESVQQVSNAKAKKPAERDCSKCKKKGHLAKVCHSKKAVKADTHAVR